MTADDFVILNDGVHSSCEDAGTTSLSESECREANAALASDVSWGSMPSHQLIGYGDDDDDDDTLTSTYPLKCLLVQTVNPEYADHDADPYDTDYGTITRFGYQGSAETTIDGVKCGRMHCVQPHEYATGAIDDDQDFPSECYGLSNRHSNHFSCVCHAFPPGSAPPPSPPPL